MKRIPSRGRHPFAAVELVFESGGKPINDEIGEPLALGDATADDEWGNSVPFERAGIGHSNRMGAFLPAASRRMTLHVPVRRTGNYRREESAVLMILEGTISADGLSVNFQTGPDAARLGIENGCVGAIRSTKGSFETEGWKMLEVPISGKGSSTELTKLKSRMGEILDWDFLAFPESSRESAGIVPIRVGDTSTGTLGFEFCIPFHWEAPPEMVKPGAKLRIGVSGQMPGDQLTFEVDLPAEISGE